jgi:hypothetical protein
MLVVEKMKEKGGMREVLKVQLNQGGSKKL